MDANGYEEGDGGTTGVTTTTTPLGTFSVPDGSAGGAPPGLSLTGIGEGEGESSNGNGANGGPSAAGASDGATGQAGDGNGDGNGNNGDGATGNPSMYGPDNHPGGPGKDVGFGVEANHDTHVMRFYEPMYEHKVTQSIFGEASLGNIENKIGLDLWDARESSASFQISKNISISFGPSRFSLKASSESAFNQFYIGNENDGRSKIGYMAGKALTTNSSSITQHDIYATNMNTAALLMKAIIVRHQVRQNISNTFSNVQYYQAPSPPAASPALIPPMVMTFLRYAR